MKDLSILDSLITGRVEPHIYAFTTNTIPNHLKVGDTYRPVSKRLSEWREHFPNLEKKFEGSAKITDDVYFRDFSVHSFLESEKHRIRLAPADLSGDVYHSREFFREATVNDIEEAIADIHEDFHSQSGRYHYYDAKTQLPATLKYASTGMWEPRPNQQATIDAFQRAVHNGRTHLLMYAVMRFGKSFTSLCCAKAMEAKFVVVVSAKADVCDEWRKTVESAENFRNEYEFFSSADLENNYGIVADTLDRPADPKRVVVFLTLQDLQGEHIKARHAQIFDRKIDLLLVDETHFGARAEKYGAVLRAGQGEKLSGEEKYAVEDILECAKALDARVTIHLSGTPYRILMSDEFDREQDLIAFYQFTDIVREQEEWDRENFAKDEPREEWENPYFGFPQMIRFALNPNESARKRMAALRESGMSDAFSALFKPKSVVKAGDGSHKQFVHEQEILELLEVIDGSREDEELLGFLDYEKIKDGNMCRHIVVVLPYCASCDALEALIEKHAGAFKNLSGYEIINISGVENPSRYKKPGDIKRAISNYESEGKKTITLTVNRMLTGSTVPEWDTMLFLRDTSSPQEYDQAIFRLQNQYIREYIGDDGKTIRFNMKPQTILVDFDPDRVFVMQEQKAQIYNVNTDEAGNSRLRERMEEELRISPVIVMNKDKIVQITAADILKAVSEYSKTRGVAEETVEIPVDMSLLAIDAIREAIERENELGSKAGLTIKGADGEGDEMDTPDDTEPANTTGATGTNPGTETQTDEPADTAQTEEKGKDAVRQFRSYYARILFFAFLTRNTVISLSDLVDCIDEPNNARIAGNLGISRTVLEGMLTHADKFVLRRLDYKIYNLNRLSHDDSVDPVARASVSVQKFGKLGESEVITPKHVCRAMIGMIDDADLRAVVDNGNKVLDIAGKAGEFALAVFEKYAALGYGREALKDAIYTIPTSGITYEFTRMIYEILGLNVDNIASGFNSYSLLKVTDEDGDIDNTKIAALLKQNKPFDTITMKDEITAGDETVNFDVVLGNPPYQVGDGGAQASARPIYHKFVEAAKKLEPAFMTMIMPTRWYAGGKGLDEFRNDMLNDTRIAELHDFLHPEEVFPDTNNRGGVCYLLWDCKHDNADSMVRIVSHEGNGNITTSMRKLRYKDLDIFIRNSAAINILNKVIADETVDTMERHISPRKPFGLDGNFIKTADFKKTDTGMTNPVKCYGKAKTAGYVERSKIPSHAEWIDTWKVFMPYANNIGTELTDDNQNTFVAAPNSICTETFLIAGVDLELDESSAGNLSNYLRTRFARFLLSMAKISQHGTSKTYRFVPVQDFSRAWTDADLYARYGLTEEEVALIEAKIKEMN